MKIRTVALAGVAAVALSAPALADDPGWYIGLGAGYAHPEPVLMKFDNPTATPRFFNADYKPNWLALGSVGYKFEDHLRIEVEFSYTENDAKQVVTTGGTFLAPATGGMSEAAGMINVNYDFDLGGRWGATIGAGLGAGDVNEYGYVDGAKRLQGAAWGFAWQGMVGLSYQFSEHFQIFADLRYRSVDPAHFYQDPTFGNECDCGTDPIRVHQIHEEAALGGIRYYFGEAPPPPPPPPPPAPPPPPPPPPPVKTFIVFFDFDKSNLTAEAQSVVQEAVKTAKTNGMVKVLITGHTDTVGSDSYNQGLSVRRANTVKDEMVHEGMDGSTISIEGKSFHDPLVPTGPGVREPQNRRAVIDLGS